MKFNLDMSYKGDRNYLHGSDFFNHLNNIRSKVTGIETSFIEQLAFHKISTNLCELHTVRPLNLDRITGKVKYKTASEAPDIEGWIVETEDTVVGRYPYDENIVENEATIDQKKQQIALNSTVNYTTIEVIIALTKILNYSLSPDVKGKWLFGKINLKGILCENYEHMAIHMQRMVPNRFSVSEIIINDKPIGTIQFVAG